jgi:hypothetical protein
LPPDPASHRFTVSPHTEPHTGPEAVLLPNASLQPLNPDSPEFLARFQELAEARANCTDELELTLANEAFLDLAEVLIEHIGRQSESGGPINTALAAHLQTALDAIKADEESIEFPTLASLTNTS